ncbi:Piwi domain-containing protein [Mycena crocata]|nr:Piwi domain-containing protein [Mycena crocata]
MILVCKTFLLSLPLHIVHVAFQPEQPIANKRQEILHRLQTSVAPEIFHPRGIYDGKSLLYLSHRLNVPGANCKVPSTLSLYTHRLSHYHSLRDRLNELIKNGEEAHGEAATAINLLQLLIRQSLSQCVHSSFRSRAYFLAAGKKDLPGTGIELWRGFFQSVRPTIGRMLVTIDASIAAMYESGQLMDVALHVLKSKNTRDLSLTSDRHPNFSKLQTHFRNRQIKTKTSGDRTKTIHGLVKGPIGSLRFEKNGASITIAEYYHRAHNIHLAHPETFGVRLSGRNAQNAVIVPAEICIIIPGQLYKRHIPASATSQVADFATIPPNIRKQVITDGHQHGIQSPVSNVCVAGMSVDSRPLTLSAKLLAHPHMNFKDLDVVRQFLCLCDIKPNNGAWNVANTRFKVARRMKSWAVVNFDAFGRINQDLAKRTILQFIKCCQALGVADPVAVLQGHGNSPEKTLDNILTQYARLDLILVLLPSRAEELRNRVKFWGDIKHGIHTSCLREDKLQKASNLYFNNVAIKVNARLGGHYALPRYPSQRPTVIQELQQAPFMIMGADVSHPGPGVLRPSISSLVWSHDLEAASYVAFSDVQAPRQEMIAGLQEMVKRAIQQFGKKNLPPQRIIFYRDGVSEGEFETVKAAEITAIRSEQHPTYTSYEILTHFADACAELWEETGLKLPLPKLTVIIVVKRHHVVFFPNDNEVNDGKTGNCRSGLVVDALRSPFATDFYLQAHSAVKGTSRSGHYSVLLDQNFNNDISKMQRLSFELCHVYAKATRSISIPAPVYCRLSDIVCARGKFHVDPTRLDFDVSTTASAAEEFDLEYWKQAYEPANGAFSYDKSMYFL